MIRLMNKKLKIFILAICFIGLNTIISNAAIHSTDPTATVNSTVSITITSDQALDNFNINVTNSGGLTFSSVSTKGISNGTAVGYMTLSEPLTTLATYTFKTPSTPGTYKVVFDVNGVSNTSAVKVTEASNNSSNSNASNNNTNQQKPQQPQAPTKSNVATLSNLGIRPNDFSGFKANTLTYNTEVPYETDKIEIYASKGQSGQTISGTGTKTLKEGQNSFNVTVTAEDGKTTKTYTINVTRKQQGETEEPETPTEENPEEPIEAFGLTDLKIEGLELNPEFQTDIHEYKIDLTEDLEKLNITASPTHPDTVVEITGNENLIEGENIITIVVKPEDEADNASENNIATYQIIVNKTLPKEEEANTEECKIDKKVILISVGAIIVVIIVIFIIVKLRKNKDDGEYVTYTEFYAKDMEEIKEDEPIEENKEEDFEEEIKKKKRSKGKRFK